MADQPPALPPEAQAAAVRQMLAADAALTLEGIETTHPSLADGVKIILEERKNPTAAQSGSAPMESLVLTDLV